MSDARTTVDATPSTNDAVVDVTAATAPEPARVALRRLGARLAYWTPVFAALALFAQIAFLGLRPAISEARRLADASDVLEARWAHDRGLYDAYELQLRVRNDPIFRERQRRLRCTVPASASSGV